MVGNKAVRHLQYSLVPTQQAQQMWCHFWSRHCQAWQAMHYAVSHFWLLCIYHRDQHAVTLAQLV